MDKRFNVNGPPVTVGGWYEQANGSVAEYAWFRGEVRMVRSAVSWSEVGRIKAEDRKLVVTDGPFGEH